MGQALIMVSHKKKVLQNLINLSLYKIKIIQNNGKENYSHLAVVAQSRRV